ncbi:regulatory protein, luxR family [Loktanella sp. DSM 29012]|uniref:helix-turn-helix transcriptional regulator n=1 Tax=Loktanella sp. DSM 29012 TaxID=1881056 RepID=UPI0008CC57C5|nr:helix-turn-helix transcriptional regulator [Loktanella sp. DSM 29012]SEQ77501.1 regulatory protein, luxR family [Loktanella sp. DSM 29012]
MSRLWITGTAMIAAIAALKTCLVMHFALSPAQATPLVLGALFVAFFMLTTGVGVLAYGQVKRNLNSERRRRMAPGASEPVAKETVISRYAQDWALSQAEADVAIFVAKGFSNSEIADMRGSALSTVKSQLGAIYTKSGLGSRYQLMAFVTDEVCAMAKEAEQAPAAPARIDTRKVLPLVGRARRAAPARDAQDLNHRAAG